MYTFFLAEPMDFCYENRNFGHNGGISAIAIDKRSCFCRTWIDPQNLKQNNQRGRTDVIEKYKHLCTFTAKMTEQYAVRNNFLVNCQ
jgi:hypothetical protein